VIIVRQRERICVDRIPESATALDVDH
jgi:hypothetical protein